MANKFCTSCGTALDENTKFCTTCGATVEIEKMQEVKAETKTATGQTAATTKTNQSVPPVYSTASQTIPPSRGGYTPVNEIPGSDSKYEPITTMGYIGIMLLMGIPVIGFILILIWAFGGCRKINKRNLARASLIMMVIAVILGVVATFAVKSIINNVIEQIEEETGIDIDQLTGGDNDTRLDDWMNSQETETNDEMNGDVENIDDTTQQNENTQDANVESSDAQDDTNVEGEYSTEDIENLEDIVNSMENNDGTTDLGALMNMLEILSKFGGN